MNWTFQEIAFEFMSSDSVSNINDDWTLWRGTFLATADNFIPKKTRKGRYHPPLLTGEILHMLKRKETLRWKLIRVKRSSLLEKYKNLRRKRKNLIKLSLENFFASLSDYISSNPKLFWSFFKTSIKSSRIPSQVSVPSGNTGPTRAVSNSLRNRPVCSISTLTRCF